VRRSCPTETTTVSRLHITYQVLISSQSTYLLPCTPRTLRTSAKTMNTRNALHLTSPQCGDRTFRSEQRLVQGHGSSTFSVLLSDRDRRKTGESKATSLHANFVVNTQISNAPTLSFSIPGSHPTRDEAKKLPAPITGIRNHKNKSPKHSSQPSR